ncbi:uncharacterized protein ppp1r18 [Syngnathus typhle]|uniref:uncharacterized protein ppp1r18 n=1 Tax=Syngnathus typhle TaxID=161592 RepID=UPI002A6B0749|nr:uncharacterized protein ppp1r18 [Syngnathus typhle]
MSVSSLPEWKQLLLERKRREEEERERREKEEEQKFADMPAWKRGIIQRRKAKQEKDIPVLPLDAQPSSDLPSDTETSANVNQRNELSPEPSQWMDADPKLASQVSVETIVPLHENPFILTQSMWRRSKEGDGGYQERGNDSEVKEKDKLTPRGHDGETGRGRKIEQKIERFRDLSEGRDKERSRDRSQGRDNSKEIWKESVRDGAKEKEENERDPANSFSPMVPCLRTIRADNIIIIEQNRRGSDEIRTKWRELEVEQPEEDSQGKRGMKMDLREILAGGASVTEIRASDVLIIKPTTGLEERSSGGGGANPNERPSGPETVMKDSSDDNVFSERGGRVSQLLSKFGELRKPPSRSKSSDNFLRPGRRKNSQENNEQTSGVSLKGVPKRSFSFSDRVVCAKENGLDPDGYFERKRLQRIHSDRSGKEIPVMCKKDKYGKQNDGQLEGQSHTIQKRSDTGMGFQNRSEVKKLDPVERRPTGDEDREGFTTASVKSTEGISFARRIPIRQDGKSKMAEREAGAVSDRGTEWELLSHHTEELISKIEKIIDDPPYRNEAHEVAPRSPKMGNSPGPLEIQIPRTVFYVAEEMARKKKEGKDSEEGVERRDSWRLGKPVSRIESLREKIRQKEQGQNGGESTCEEPEKDKEHKRRTEADTSVQTSGSAFDITQEVDVLKNCPHLPVSALDSPTAAGEEVSSGFENAPSEDRDQCLQKSDTLKDADRQVTQQRSQRPSQEGNQEDTKDSDVKVNASSIEPGQAPSPSPPHPNSLAEMSRIYNLETVGSRSGLCLRERNVDVSSVHLIKVKPLIDTHKGDGQGEDASGLKTIQLQFEQFQLKEQEVLTSQHVSSNSPCKDKEVKGFRKHQTGEMVKETSEINPKVCLRRVGASPTSQLKQPNPINSSYHKSQSQDKSAKASDGAPTPASSPCSTSPAASPAPSPTFFTIRSASNRGATITITPKKNTGTAKTTDTKIPQASQQTQTVSTESTKKKYPAVEDIEVIGGYQNLEKSCLVRSKGTPKRGKVCFDEDRLEQVCEYPSETSMMVSTPYPHETGTPETPQGEEPQEDEGEVDGDVMSKGPRNLGTAFGRSLRVDESCPR